MNLVGLVGQEIHWAGQLERSPVCIKTNWVYYYRGSITERSQISYKINVLGIIT